MHRSLLAVCIVVCLGVATLPSYAQMPQPELALWGGAAGGGAPSPRVTIRKGLNFDIKSFLAQNDLRADIIGGSFRGDSISYRIYTLQLDYFPKDPWGATLAFSSGKSESFDARTADVFGPAKEDRKDFDLYLHYTVPTATLEKMGLGKYNVLLTPGYKKTSFEGGTGGGAYKFGYKGLYIGAKLIGSEIKLSKGLRPRWYVSGFYLPSLKGTDQASGSDGNGGGFELGLSQTSFGQKSDLRYGIAFRWQKFGGGKTFPGVMGGGLVDSSVAVQDTFTGIVLNVGVSF